MISWDEPNATSDFDWYYIYMDDDYFSKVARSSENKFQIDQDLKPGLKHKIAIKTVSGSQYDNRASDATEMSLIVPPLPPTHISYQWLNDSTILLEWEVSDESHQDAFNISVINKTFNKKFKPIRVENVTSYPINDIDNFNVYNIQIVSLSNGVPSISAIIIIDYNPGPYLKKIVPKIIWSERNEDLLYMREEHIDDEQTKTSGSTPVLLVIAVVILLIGIYYIFFIHANYWALKSWVDVKIKKYIAKVTETTPLFDESYFLSLLLTIMYSRDGYTPILGVYKKINLFP